MAVKTLDSNQARNHWREMLDTVLASNADVVITRYSQPVAAVVSYEDYLAVADELTNRTAPRPADHCRGQSDHACIGTGFSTRLGNTQEDAAWATL